MTEERYDLKESKRSVRELYPVLKDAHGNIIDGFHRLREVPEWRTETLEHIKTPTQLWLARIIANTHRRTVSREERAHQIEMLAKSLIEHDKVPKHEIVSTVAELITFSERYVQMLIPDDYKRSYEKSELSSDMDVKYVQDFTVPSGTPEPLGLTTQEVVPPGPSINGLEETPATPTDEDSEVTETIAMPTFQEFIVDTYARIPGASEEWVASVLQSKFSLSPREARDEIRQYKGQGRPSPSAEAEAKSEPRKATYAPPKPPTTRCPLCGRDGADKQRILTHIEDPQVAQLTLEQFIKEAMRR